MSQFSRRGFLMGASAAPLLAQRGKKAAAPPRPNVVLILAEDIGAWMCSCYGSREIRTPNIDHLAQLGVRFLNAFTTTPAGSPSRATLLTGRTPKQHGIHDFLTSSPVQNPPQGQAAASPWFAEETMLSDVLAAAGYNCGYAGKWDMGNDANPGHGLSYTYTMAGGEQPYTNPMMSRNGEVSAESGYTTGLITGGATSFLDQQTADKPFFLTVSYPNAHGPYDGHPQKFYDEYASSKFEALGWLPKAENALRNAGLMEDPVAAARRFGAGVAAFDHQIPYLLKKLQEKKFWSNTLIVFTTTCGNLLGRHGLWGSGLASNPPNMYDEVMQVPCIASWPGEIPVQATRPDMVSAYDLMPTLAQACQTSAPAGKDLCGLSFYPHLVRQPMPEGESWPGAVFGTYQNTLMMRDNRFKLIIRNGGDGPNEFYNHTADPREMRNEYDNPVIVTVRDRMRAVLDAWAARHAA